MYDIRWELETSLSFLWSYSSVYWVPAFRNGESLPGSWQRKSIGFMAVGILPWSAFSTQQSPGSSKPASCSQAVSLKMESSVSQITYLGPGSHIHESLTQNTGRRVTLWHLVAFCLLQHSEKVHSSILPSHLGPAPDPSPGPAHSLS